MKEKLYRFRKSKQLGKYQVMFKHIPGKWISTGKTEVADAVLFAKDFLFALHEEVEAYLPDQPIYETIRHKLPEMGNVFASSTD